MRKVLLSAVFLGLSLGYARSASAMGASAGVLVGNGFKDHYNLGFGVRGGVTLPMSIYVGGTFVYHLGDSESTPAGDVSSNLFYFGAEGGYDIGAGPLTVRPYLGLGYTSLHVSGPNFCAAGACIGGSDSASRFALWPGATVILPLGGFFVGADARYVVVVNAEGEANAFSAFATAGLNF